MASGKLKHKVFYLSRDLTWPNDQKNMRLLSLLFLIISYHPVKFSSHRSRENGDRRFFIRHVTWCVHVINGLCNFVDNIFSSEATSLSSFVAIGLMEVEIQLFLICHVITWSDVSHLIAKARFHINYLFEDKNIYNSMSAIFFKNQESHYP